jgi:signal transduction histidine kinase
MFSLLAGTTLAILFLLIFLHRWNRSLDKEVNKRTDDLEKANQLLRLANEQLKAQDKIQNEFINVAAHELRTPLQPIIGYSDYALKGKVDVNHALPIIYRHAKRLLNLATDLLVVTRIETGNFPYKMEQVKINDLIVEVVNNIIEGSDAKFEESRLQVNSSIKDYSSNPIETPTGAWQEDFDGDGNSSVGKSNLDNYIKKIKVAGQREAGKSIRDIKELDEIQLTETKKEVSEKITKLGELSIVLDLDDSIGNIYADKERISQVLSNMVNNSVKFTDKGTIKIVTGWSSADKNMLDCKVGAGNDGGEKLDNDPLVYRHERVVEIRISDTGQGIPQEVMKNLFEKFVTRGQSKRPNIHGTGLGLFISKSIISYHGGTIKAWNNATGGATFSILLPLDGTNSQRK